jgi:hypothetical protein
MGHVRCDQGFSPCVARFTLDGRPAAGFGDDGIVVLEALGPRNSRGMLVDAEGVLVLGMINSDLQLARVSSAGVVDADFGVEGVATIAVTGDLEARQMIADGAGGAYITGDNALGFGEESSEVWVFHVDAAGALVGDFGTDGITVIDTRVATDPDLVQMFHGTMIATSDRLLVAVGLQNDGGIGKSDGPVVALRR